MSISRLNAIPRFALPYNSGDFIAGLRAILAGGPPAEAFPLFDGKPRFWTRSGRQALYLLLGALQLKQGSGIALPLFTDPSLVRAIVAAGHRPVFIDVDPRYLTIDPQCLEDARGSFSAVVAVHLFGQLADMPAVMTAARGAPIIEDTAHAPLSLLHGRQAGSFGVAAFYSFASTKYWPAGGGGLAVVNDTSLTQRVAGSVESLSRPSRIQEIRDLIMQAAKAAVFHRRLYGFCGRPLRRWVEKWALLEPHLDRTRIERPWATIATRQAQRLPQRVALQRANSLQLLIRLDLTEEVVLPRERPGASYNYHLFPVLLRSREERAAVMAAMWSRFVDTSMIYSNVVAEARRFGYLGGSPVAESVADRLITLPNYASLSVRDINSVAYAFLSSLREFRRVRRQPLPHPQLTEVSSSR
ncbi:MAG TPA: DegT/DnrJ/EryC1/StrS family aminotransferase [Bryobacteraceae bacterium]|nr:DegT/DnrJ/EryC1/StrS family aminotransferase [Bryobacteraceae bacterium]